jgi:tetratricopeptide (TPR) repeat protein
MSSKIIKHLFVFVVAFVFCAFFWEYMVRIFSPQKILPNYHASNFGVPNSLLPNHKVELKNHRVFPPYIVETNKYGLRMSKDMAYEKPENTFRIMCFGDSILFGSGVNAQEMYTSQLEVLLNKNLNDGLYEVIPAAVEGWGPLEYYTYFKNEGYKYSPDLIILNNFVDDIKPPFTEFITFKSIKKKGDTIFLEKMEIDLQKFTFIKIIFSWISKLSIYNELSRFSHALYLIRLNLFGASFGEEAFFKKKGVRLHDFLKTINIDDLSKFTWVLDNHEIKVPKIKRNPLKFFGKINKEPPRIYKANTAIYYLVMNTLLGLIKENGAKTIILNVPSHLEVYKMSFPAPRLPLTSLKNVEYNFDLLYLFQVMQTNHPIQIFFEDDYHWTPSGHRLAAQLVYRFLAEKVFPSILKPLNIWSPENITLIQNSNSRIAKHLDKSPFKIYLKAMSSRNKGDSENAKKFFELYLEKEPEDYEAHYQFGSFLFGLRAFEEALEQFKVARKGHFLEQGKYTYAHNFMKIFSKANKLFLENNYEEALIQLEKVKQLKGSWQHNVFSFMGSIYLKMKDIGKAEKAYLKAFYLKPEFKGYSQNLGNLYFDKGEFDKAIQYYEKSIKLNNNDLKIRLMIAFAYKKLGNEEKGIEYFNQFFSRCGNSCGELLKKWNFVPN